MSLLTELPPEFVVVSGVRYPVHTDFRVWIDFELAILDGNMPDNKRISALLKPYREELPALFDEAVRALVEFYAGDGKDGKDGGGEVKSPVYSFLYDADYIYAAFWQQYGIDLQAARLHWYAFKALFRGLGEDVRIVKMMEYRSVNLADIKDKEQKKFYRKMKRLYRLPDMRSEEEKERDMISSIAGLF